MMCLCSSEETEEHWRSRGWTKGIKGILSTSHSPSICSNSGCGCTGGGVRVTVTAKVGPVGLNQRAMDEISFIDQYWTAFVTATEWHQRSKLWCSSISHFVLCGIKICQCGIQRYQVLILPVMVLIGMTKPHAKNHVKGIRWPYYALLGPVFGSYWCMDQLILVGHIWADRETVYKTKLYQSQN